MRFRRFGVLALGAAFCAAMPAHAQQVKSYQACLDMVDIDPAKGLQAAKDWQAAGGGNAAVHCGALALADLGRLSEAAELFMELGDTLSETAGGNAAETYLQAAAAYQSVGDNSRAMGAIEKAISVGGKTPDLLVERARAELLAGDPRGAIDDASAVLTEEPNRVEALLLRAAAWRLMGVPEAALDDAKKAIEIAPRDPDAFLEHGLAAYGVGDEATARSDFDQALQLAQATGRGDMAVADAAQSYLEILDGNQ